MLAIAYDRLDGPITIQEVEEQIAEEGVLDLWLDQWRLFVSHFGPGDELWIFFGSVLKEPNAEGMDLDYDDEGYALLRGGEIVEIMSFPSA